MMMMMRAANRVSFRPGRAAGATAAAVVLFLAAGAAAAQSA